MVLMQRGDFAQCGGWLARAQRLVDDNELDCVECGYLRVPAGLMSLDRGDLQAGHDEFEAAGRYAARFDDPDLTALSRLGRGQALIRLDQRMAGMRLFDDAMLDVTGGEVSAVVSGIVYCAVVDECHQCLDIERAVEWTAALSRWCERQPDLVPYRGQCLVHRSQVLTLQGRWPEALDEARRAVERLADPPHPALGAAHYQLGELLWFGGELGPAEAEYRLAFELGRLPQPGLALLRLAQGRSTAAATAVDAALAEASDPVERAALLPAAVEILLAAENVPAATDAAAELALTAGRADVPFLTAAAAMAQGQVRLSGGDARSALEPLRAAWRRWHRLGLPYQAARTRHLIAQAHRELGDDDTADVESEAAGQELAQLGAVAVGAEPTTGSSPHVPTESLLSPREVEVLRLVAGGKTNREVAAHLTISERTVERHVSNLFDKLGVPNRAAATAAAFERNLL
jgi:ATP/maltotriose-dependent transcriptional regulator MalT